MDVRNVKAMSQPAIRAVLLCCGDCSGREIVMPVCTSGAAGFLSLARVLPRVQNPKVEGANALPERNRRSRGAISARRIGTTNGTTPDRGKTKDRLARGGLSSSGGGIRTRDLRVMRSPHPMSAQDETTSGTTAPAFEDPGSALLDCQPALDGATPFKRTGIAAQLRYDQCRLQRYPPAHLRGAVLAVVEGDRHLLDAEASA
jgi:hypothetical protein